MVTSGVGTGGAYVHGVTFPVDQDVIECLQDYKAGNVNYVQLVRPLALVPARLR